MKNLAFGGIIYIVGGSVWLAETVFIFFDGSKIAKDIKKQVDEIKRNLRDFQDENMKLSLNIESLTKTKEELGNEITAGKGVKELKPGDVAVKDKNVKNILEKMLGFYDIPSDVVSTLTQLTPETLIDILDENTKGVPNKGKLHKYFLGQVNAAEAVKINGVRSKLNQLQDKLTELDIEGNLRKKVKITDKLELTRNEMLDVFIKTHDPAILASMLKGGVGFNLDKKEQ